MLFELKHRIPAETLQQMKRMILVAHTENEQVSKSELIRAVDLYADMVGMLLARDEQTARGAPQ